MAKNKQEASLENRLIYYYKQNGLQRFLEVCAAMLDIKDKANFEKKKTANGEVCEVVLRVMTQHYLKAKGIRGVTLSSVILNDKDNPKSSFCTELDTVLLTPWFCLTGECKSYVGDIVVTSECTLNRKSLVTDVAKQSKLHGVHLRKHLQAFAVEESRSQPPFGLFCFLYSNGTLTDKRTTEAKNTIPVLTVQTLYGYYDKLFRKFKREVYNYAAMETYFRKLSVSKKLHEQHRVFLDY